MLLRISLFNQLCPDKASPGVLEFMGFIFSTAHASLRQVFFSHVAQTLVFEKDFQYLHLWMQIALKEHTLQYDSC